MANLKSSKKDIRRIAKKTVANKSVRTSLKTYVKRVREAIASGDQATITAAVTTVQKQLDKAAKRGVIHPNQAARRKSRIMSQATKVAPAGEATVAPAKKAVAPKAAATKAAAPKAKAAPKATKPKADKA